MSTLGKARITILWEDELRTSAKMLHGIMKALAKKNKTKKEAEEIPKMVNATFQVCYAALYPITGSQIIVTNKNNFKS